MDWLKNWNQALDYLEENLAGEIRLEELGRLAGCSGYHFQRMFSYLAGVPLKEYIRRRRMTRAAADLRTGEKVLDVALRYGYDSPTAFNRAFQSIHGVAPSLAKQDGVKLKAFPCIRFKFVLKGDTEMEYQIVRREAFRIVGIRMPLPQDTDDSFSQVPQFWMENAARIPAVGALIDGTLPGLLGVSTCHGGEFEHYYIAAATQAPAPEGMWEEEIPACTWAVFSGSGRMPETMQELQKRIVTEWLPGSGYEWAKAPDVEVYLTPPGAPDVVFQIWLPIREAPGK